MKNFLILFLTLIYLSGANAQQITPAKKELKKTRIFLVTGWVAIGAGTYCTFNAYEAHQKFVFNYNRGYSTDIPQYFKAFKNQMIGSICFASAGLVLQGCALYHFAKYRELTSDKVSFIIKPNGIGFKFSLR